MLIKSQLITQASGSVGGLTASRNRGGMYLRARTIPVDPGTSEQTRIRSYMAAFVDAWTTTLTQAQRDAWAVYALNVPVVGKLGDVIFLTGQQHYLRTSIPRKQAGQSLATDAPTTFSTGSFTQLTLLMIGGMTTISVTFDDTDDWVGEDDAFLAIYLSRPANPSINYFKGPYRFSDVVEGDSITPPTSPVTVTVPFPVSSGLKVFSQARVGRADGRLSGVQRQETLAS